MNEQTLIAVAIALNSIFSPIATFVYAKCAIEEIKSLFWNVFLPIYLIYTDRYLYKIGMGSKVGKPDFSGYTVFCWKFFLMALLKIALILLYTFIAICLAIISYECARWTFNLHFSA